MFALKIVDASFSEIISKIVREASKDGAAGLGMREEDFPNFVAFESPNAVRKRVENGDTPVLAYLQDQIVGTVRYARDTTDPQKGYIKRLAVLPEHRHSGCGDALMAFAESQLREMGVTRVELAIVATLTRLQAYYTRLGYTPKERKTFPTLPYEVLFMEKRLNGQG
jgi:ribosomal protein S18 acetylase RimI-like enzyme